MSTVLGSRALAKGQITPRSMEGLKKLYHHVIGPPQYEEENLVISRIEQKLASVERIQKIAFCNRVDSRKDWSGTIMLVRAPQVERKHLIRADCQQRQRPFGLDELGLWAGEHIALQLRCLGVA